MTGTGSGSGSSGSGTGTGTSGTGTGTGSGSGSGNNTGSTQSLYALEGTFGTAASIEQFSVNNSTGALTSANIMAGINDREGQIASDPKSQFVFVAYSAPSSNLQAGCTVASYSLGANGQLTLSDQEKIPNNCDTVAAATVDASGTYLYVSGNVVATSGMISTYVIDRTTGKLVNKPPDVGIAAVAMPGKIVIHPSGTFAYVSRLTPHHYPGQGGWSLYLRDPATGALTDTGKVYNEPTWPNEYLDAAFVLGGKYLFGTDGSKYDAYSVDPISGALTFVGKQPGQFWGITADPSGNFLVITQRDGPIQSYQVNSNGTLTPVGGGTTANITNISNVPTGITVTFDRTGKYVYAESLSTAQIFAFTFDSSTGALGAVPGSPFATKAQPENLATAGH
jgi:6-phosphogluconolactonase (cycloisomerase 2 family)